MVKTQLEGHAADGSARNGAAAVHRDRVSRYAAIAKVAAAIPTAILAANADATIYSQTGLNVTISNSSTKGAVETFQITGAAGAVVVTVNVNRWSNASRVSWASVALVNGIGTAAGNASFQQVFQRSAATSSAATWYGGLPVRAGATWNNPGRNLNADFKGVANSSRIGATGAINFGNSNTAFTFNNDPQNVGNAGDTWYLLFKFNAGAASGNYGWLSFTANVVGFGNASITFTGWGWSDSGTPFGAGASAVPGGTGLAALAFGAAGLRGRRRSRN